MQISRISLIPLLLAAVADATNADRATKPNRRDVIARRNSLGGSTSFFEFQKKSAVVKKKRTPAKTGKKTGGGGIGDDDENQNNDANANDNDSDDENDGTTVRLNYALAAGAGMVAMGAMMM